MQSPPQTYINDDETYDEGSDTASKAIVAKPKRAQGKRRQSLDCSDELGAPSEPLKKKGRLRLND